MGLNHSGPGRNEEKKSVECERIKIFFREILKSEELNRVDRNIKLALFLLTTFQQE